MPAVLRCARPSKPLVPRETYPLTQPSLSPKRPPRSRRRPSFKGADGSLGRLTIRGRIRAPAPAPAPDAPHRPARLPPRTKRSRSPPTLLGSPLGEPKGRAAAENDAEAEEETRRWPKEEDSSVGRAAGRGNTAGRRDRSTTRRAGRPGPAKSGCAVHRRPGTPRPRRHARARRPGSLGASAPAGQRAQAEMQCAPAVPPALPPQTPPREEPPRDPFLLTHTLLFHLYRKTNCTRRTLARRPSPAPV